MISNQEKERDGGTESEHDVDACLARLENADGCDEEDGAEREQCGVDVDGKAYLEKDEDKGEREDDRRAGDGQALIKAAHFLGLFLARLFGDVVKTEADQRRQHVQTKKRQKIPLSQPRGKADGGGKHTKANEIRERIDLDAVAALFIASVFFHARDFAVEEIAKAREEQAKNREKRLACCREPEARDARDHAEVGQPDRIIVKTYHVSVPFKEERTVLTAVGQNESLLILYTK